MQISWHFEMSGGSSPASVAGAVDVDGFDELRRAVAEWLLQFFRRRVQEYEAIGREGCPCRQRVALETFAESVAREVVEKVQGVMAFVSSETSEVMASNLEESAEMPTAAQDVTTTVGSSSCDLGVVASPCSSSSTDDEFPQATAMTMVFEENDHEDPPVSTRLCSNCRRPGHNRRRCREVSR